MKQYEEYIAQYCRTGRYTPKEARKHAVCREVEKYYNSENRAVIPMRHEFTCCSES